MPNHVEIAMATAKRAAAAATFSGDRFVEATGLARPSNPKFHLAVETISLIG